MQVIGTRFGQPRALLRKQQNVSDCCLSYSGKSASSPEKLVKGASSIGRQSVK